MPGAACGAAPARSADAMDVAARRAMSSNERLAGTPTSERGYRGGGSGALLQRGARDRQGGRRFPRGAARGGHLRLRQQFDRQHRRGRARGRRRGSPREPSGQGLRGAAHVQRRRGRHLRAGRRRRDLRRAERAGDDRQARRRAARHGGGDPRRSRRGGLSPRPSRRQPAADRLCRPHVRPRLHRYPVRLSGVLAPLRQIVSRFCPAASRSRPN